MATLTELNRDADTLAAIRALLKPEPVVGEASADRFAYENEMYVTIWLHLRFGETSMAIHFGHAGEKDNAYSVAGSIVARISDIKRTLALVGSELQMEAGFPTDQLGQQSVIAQMIYDGRKPKE